MATLAIVDDNKVHREFYQDGITEYGGFTKVSAFENCYNFLDYCGHSKQLPDLLICDVKMPDMNGMMLTEYVTHFMEGNIIVMGMTGFPQMNSLEQMIMCGARGMIFKNADFKEAPSKKTIQPFADMVNTLLTTPSSHIELPKALVAVLSRQYGRPVSLPEQLTAKRIAERNYYKSTYHFTDKEIKTLFLYACPQLSVKQIADLLCNSVKTIEKHIDTGLKKLEVKTRHDFATKAFSIGLSKIFIEE